MSARPEPTADATEFADFYREHFAETARLAFLLTSSAEAAQDLAQDAFVGLHRRWAKVEDPRPTSGARW
jgi:DNA-directed RNA polymerase specialized sigma24 family protein